MTNEKMDELEKLARDKAALIVDEYLAHTFELHGELPREDVKLNKLIASALAAAEAEGYARGLREAARVAERGASRMAHFEETYASENYKREHRFAAEQMLSLAKYLVKLHAAPAAEPPEGGER